MPPHDRNALPAFSRRAVGSDNQHLAQAVAARMRDEYRANCTNETAIYEGLALTLDELKTRRPSRRPDQQDQDVARQIVEHYFGTDTFDPIAGTNPTPHQARPHIHPRHPQTMEPPPAEVLFVGDSNTDVRPPTTPNLRAVGVSGVPGPPTPRSRQRRHRHRPPPRTTRPLLTSLVSICVHLWLCLQPHCTGKSGNQWLPFPASAKSLIPDQATKDRKATENRRVAAKPATAWKTPASLALHSPESPDHAPRPHSHVFIGHRWQTMPPYLGFSKRISAEGR